MYPQRCELEHALAAGKRAVQIDASNALAQSNYSLALKEAQRWSDATAAALVAAETAPQMPRFPFNLSLLDLLQRNYPRGWTNFETRWDGSNELGGRIRVRRSALEWRGVARQNAVAVGRTRFRRCVPVLPLRADACEAGSRARRQAGVGGVQGAASV